MKLLYLWDNDKEEVLTIESTQDGPEWAHYKYAVDSGIPHSWPYHRYGIYTKGDDGKGSNWQWSAVPKDRLPKKFIATLFLMGIN